MSSELECELLKLIRLTDIVLILLIIYLIKRIMTEKWY